MGHPRHAYMQLACPHPPKVVFPDCRKWLLQPAPYEVAASSSLLPGTVTLLPSQALNALRPNLPEGFPLCRGVVLPWFVLVTSPAKLHIDLARHLPHSDANCTFTAGPTCVSENALLSNSLRHTQQVLHVFNRFLSCSSTGLHSMQVGLALAHSVAVKNWRARACSHSRHVFWLSVGNGNRCARAWSIIFCRSSGFNLHGTGRQHFEQQRLLMCFDLTISHGQTIAGSDLEEMLLIQILDISE